jgi:hypothetical protein
MLQAPLGGKRQLAAQTRMAAGLAAALARHFRLLICAFACCRLMPGTSQAPPKKQQPPEEIPAAETDNL